MPADGLSLAVLIRRQPYFLGLFGVLLKVADNLFLFLRYLVVRLKRLGVYAELMLLQVAYMSVRRHHLVVFAKELLNGFSLGRTLHNN